MVQQKGKANSSSHCDRMDSLSGLFQFFFRRKQATGVCPLDIFGVFPLSDLRALYLFLYSSPAGSFSFNRLFY